MALDDLFKSGDPPGGGGDGHYVGVLRKLKQMSEERDLIFGSEAKSEWGLDYLSRPGRRVFYSIEGPTSGVVGYVLVPERDREHSDRAWNRLDLPLISRLFSLEESGWEEKMVRVVFIQVWNKMDTVILPLRELLRTGNFMETGDFTVRYGGDYSLVRPRGEPMIKLDWRLDGIFKFLAETPRH